VSRIFVSHINDTKQATRRVRILRRVVLSVLALVMGFGIGLAVFGLTPVLAGLCPSCFGFSKVADNIYIEPGAGADGREILRRYEIATTRVEAAFGPISTHPRVLVCFTDTCNAVMGGHQAFGLTYGDKLFYLGPHGHDTIIIAHELAHVVVHAQIGWRGQHSFPAWVDEGIATYVSRDTRFDLDPASCDDAQVDLPVAAKNWRHSAGLEAGKYSGLYYGSAGCRVAKWLEAHPVSGLDGLIKAHQAQ
jgi:hypothetical protein